MWPNWLFPAGAVKEDTEITMTEYLKGAKAEADHASLSTINCTPDGLKFEKSVEVTVKNATSNAISFADVKHFVEDGNAWKEMGTADFDADRNVYACSLDGFLQPLLRSGLFGIRCRKLDRKLVYRHNRQLRQDGGCRTGSDRQTENRLGNPGRPETVVGQRVLRFERL